MYRGFTPHTYKLHITQRDNPIPVTDDDESPDKLFDNAVPATKPVADEPLTVSVGECDLKLCGLPAHKASQD